MDKFFNYKRQNNTSFSLKIPTLITNWFDNLKKYQRIKIVHNYRIPKGMTIDETITIREER